MKKPTIKTGKLTALKQGLRDPTRVNVFVDHQFAFSLSAEEVIKRGLKLGQTLAEYEVSDLSSASDEEKLFAKIVNYISYRPRSVKEVRERLHHYVKDNEELVTAIMSRLESLGYLDDRAFAKWFVESRSAHRPRSYKHLASELYAKGIDKEIIQASLQEGADEKAALRALIAKKSGMEKDKLVAYLARRGFSWDSIKQELAQTKHQELDKEE